MIAELAGRFRGSPYPTDVLSFSYSDTSFSDELLGDVVISAERAKMQAGERGVRLNEELLLLSIHGLLHLSGVGDEDLKEWRRMRIAEFENLVRVVR